jgi:hypothetical protein
MIEAFGETIDDRHHGIAIGNRKRAAGAEIVLHIDCQQQIIVAWSDLHSGPVFVLITKLWRYTRVCQSEPLCKAALADLSIADTGRANILALRKSRIRSTTGQSH